MKRMYRFLGNTFYLICCLTILGGCTTTHTSASVNTQSLPPHSTTSLPAKSSGCGQLPAIPPGARVHETLAVAPDLADGQTQRDYYLQLPSSYSPYTPLPVILFFHGAGGEAATAEDAFQFAPVAEAQNIITIAPQGLHFGPDGPTFWASLGPIDFGIDELSFINSVLNDVQQHYCIATQRIYAVGVSNGGGLSAYLACRMADRIAAIVTIAGNYYAIAGGCHPSRPIAVLEIHGTNDTLIPYQGRLYYETPAFPLPSVPQWLQGWATRSGCKRGPNITIQTASVMGETWDHCQGNAVVTHFRIEGGGHGIPAQIDGVAIADVIWAFLSPQSC